MDFLKQVFNGIFIGWTWTISWTGYERKDNNVAFGRTVEGRDQAKDGSLDNREKTDGMEE